MKGSDLQVFLELLDGKVMVFNSTTIRIEPEKQLVWLGRILFPGLFDGEHPFLIEPLTERHVAFCHNAIFSGLLSKLVLKLIGKFIEAGFHAMNAALK